jgi:hypothetical protein
VTNNIKSNKADPRVCFVVGCIRRWKYAIQIERTGKVVKICERCAPKLFKPVEKV